VAGWSVTSVAYRAFLYTGAGGLVNLGTLPGAATAAARGLNDFGEVVGTSPSTSGHAFRWTPGVGMTDLGTLRGGSGMSEAFDINNGGEIVGHSDGTAFSPEPFLWRPGAGMVSLAPGSSGLALDLNDAGQVVGWIGSQAFRFTPGIGVQFLGSLPGLGRTFARAINDHGDVTGTAEDPGGNVVHLFRWTDATGMVDLGLLAENAAASGLNNRGDIVGSTGAGWLWTAAEGRRFLNDLIDPASGWAIRGAMRINDAGQISAHGRLGGSLDSHALRLDPLALASAVGQGCGGGPETPLLTTGLPVLGQPFALALARCAANRAGWILVSLVPAAPTPLGPGCAAYLDLAAPAVLAVAVTGPDGSWSGSYPLPAVPSLSGVRVALQGVVFPTAGPLGADLTNGVHGTLGF
jgi:probable HAF family extracellular repeat protein